MLPHLQVATTCAISSSVVALSFRLALDLTINKINPFNWRRTLLWNAM